MGYCHVDDGCKFAIQKLRGSNGITSAKNGTFYVADSFRGGVTVLEQQADHTLVVTDRIPVGKAVLIFLSISHFLIFADRPLDNLSVDEDGVLWAAGM